MNGVHFDELTRALGSGRSKRQALKGFFGTALGLGLLGPSMSLAEAAPSSRADIARTSAQLLSRLPNQAKLHQANLPSAFLSAIENDRRLLIAGTRAQTWSDSQLLDFQNQVSASVQQHQSLAAAIPEQTQVCFNTCSNQFASNVANCGTGLGGLLCEVIQVVAFDLCALGCILGGLQL